jgi:hypothetical protein
MVIGNCWVEQLRDSTSKGINPRRELDIGLPADTRAAANTKAPTPKSICR